MKMINKHGAPTLSGWRLKRTANGTPYHVWVGIRKDNTSRYEISIAHRIIGNTKRRDLFRDQVMSHFKGTTPRFVKYAYDYTIARPEITITVRGTEKEIVKLTRKLMKLHDEIKAIGYTLYE